MTKIVGYARTSTVEQGAGLADQEAELRAAGVTKLFSEQVSGVDASRPQLKAALGYVRDGDIFVVTKPDRLARSTRDLLNIVDQLDKAGASVRILSMGVDTATATGRLMLTMLGAIAEFERELMLERQRAGIAAAKAKGLYKGRAPTARRQSSTVEALHAEGVSVAEIVRRTGISRASVYRLIGGAGTRKAA